MGTSARAVELEGLESELATLAAHVDAATHRLLALVRRFDQLDGWAWTGAKSSAHWLSWRIGIAPGAAREHVRVARALGELPKVDEAMRLGRLSYSKVRAITRVATPANEAALVEMGLSATGWQLEKICSGVRRMAGSRPDAHDDRGVSMRQLESGLVRVTADLHADEAVAVMAAVEAARGNVSAETPRLDRASALVVVSESFRADGGKARSRERNGADRAEVVVELGPDTLGDGIAARLEDGTHVPAETFRRVACDCALTAVSTDSSGDVLAAGRRTRVVSVALRRALRKRDPCCRYPGCANRLWLDAHHLRHWAHGGETTLPNLVHLCPFHHTLVHEGGFQVTSVDGELVVHAPHGRRIDHVPAPAPVPTDAAAALITAQGDLEIDDTTPLGHWDGSPVDYSECVAAAT